MTKQVNKIVKNYLKDVSKELNCSFSLKNTFLKATKEKILEYTNDKGSITTEDLYADFGKPNEVALHLFDKEEYSNLISKAKKRARLLCAVLTITIILLVVSFLFINHLLETYGGAVTVSNTSITYEK